MKKLLSLFAFLPSLLFSQHFVQGTFSPAKDFTYAFLYKASPTSLNYLNRGKIDENGTFKIELDSTVSSGMYKIVYGVPEDANNFDFIYDGKEDIVLTFSLDEGLDFKESVENKLWASYTKSMELVNMTISNFYAQESTDKKAFKDIFKTLKDTQSAFEDASKGTMASTFIKANRPYIPTEYEDVTTYSNHLKTTFLKNVDFGNTLLQSSDFLTDRVLAYVFGMSATGSSEDYKRHVDDVAVAIGNDNPVIATSLLEHLWQKMVALENVEVANYVSDTYLFKLARATDNKELYKELMAYKNSAVGTTAMDFPITYETDGTMVSTSLHKLEGADHYLLIFWSSTCGHCLGELPKLKTFIDEHPKNIKVIAFGLEDEKENWGKTIEQFPGFIHVLGLEHWDNPVAKAYGINSTPSYFILDANKKIIAKPIDLETLETALEDLY
ncbi:MAG: TlpA disulfide reductase family protein [Gelidibacter sp.]